MKQNLIAAVILMTRATDKGWWVGGGEVNIR